MLRALHLDEAEQTHLLNLAGAARTTTRPARSVAAAASTR
jgi:hypothetical protein